MVKSSLLALLVLLARAISGNRAPSILEHPLDMTVARWADQFHFILLQVVNYSYLNASFIKMCKKAVEI